eukprot:CAMPEP_0113713156 /NCGR_PEP_ID=MMETSP0038_2-20120614/31822_1 /TAXON_ID=2898 /ORGANISM="Cryptomonas paramecium" /LENGTH=153 /DNA_ID=CAMNT_0000639825 /DNA_START=62 /DNA_END=523 /DNA_ORIENTATION=+ /assembly_acc=CAM_ASM_000170
MDRAVKIIEKESGADKMVNFKEWTNAWEKLQEEFPAVKNIKDGFRTEIWHKCPVSSDMLIDAITRVIGKGIKAETLELMKDTINKKAGEDKLVDYKEWDDAWETVQDKDAFFASQDDFLLDEIWYEVAITRDQLIAAIQEKWPESFRFKAIPD